MNQQPTKAQSPGRFPKIDLHNFESFYFTEPIQNMLQDQNPAIRLRGLQQIRNKKSHKFVKEIRNYLLDNDEQVRTEARKKLQLIEMYYRKKFSIFQDLTNKCPDHPGFRLGFAITCLRYSQNWVENAKLQEYFLRQSLKELNHLIRVFEPNCRYFYYRAQVLTALNQNRLAIEDLKKVLSQKPGHRGAMLSLIDLSFQTKEPQNTLPYIRQLCNKKLPASLQAALLFWK
jgi:predicted Zn-dependent protease